MHLKDKFCNNHRAIISAVAPRKTHLYGEDFVATHEKCKQIICYCNEFQNSKIDIIYLPITYMEWNFENGKKEVGT